MAKKNSNKQSIKKSIILMTLDVDHGGKKLQQPIDQEKEHFGIVSLMFYYHWTVECWEAD